MEGLVEREFSGFLGQGQKAGQRDKNKQRGVTLHVQSCKVAFR
jgi:hypothetical protein